MFILKIVLGLIIFSGTIKLCLVALGRVEKRDQRQEMALQGVKLRGEQREWAMGESRDA